MARTKRTKKSLKRRHEPVKMELPIELKSVNLNAAGIDIGSRRHFVAVPEGRDTVSVKQFGVFTADLEEMAEWLYQCGDQCGHGEHRLLPGSLQPKTSSCPSKRSPAFSGPSFGMH
ncbi:MAG: hypothetical protein H0U18_07075 [Pyrinomonadaceae bacterium]|jgi:hypothetical protein|nr:hypothetical protein [Pyrinomonadaceae bacterium]